MSDSVKAVTLPIKSITYNHGSRRVVIDFIADQFAIDQLVELTVAGKKLRTKSWKIAAKEKAARVVAVFDDVAFSDLDKIYLLKFDVDGQQVSYDYKPSAYIVIGWAETQVSLQDLTSLIAFPRSGGQFVQNVIKKNTSGIFCSTIYNDDVVIRKHMNLKSHALTMGAVRSELRSIWDVEEVKFKPIILVRDPRDIFLSMYDYVWKMRDVKLEPKDFLHADYYWYFFEPELIMTVRAGQTHALSMIDAYRIWYRNWITPIAPPPQSIQVKYEALVSDPNTAFGPIFEHVGQKIPVEIKALDKIVARNGGSKRPRARAHGWREAPKIYLPIIEAVSDALKNELRDMGYEN
jgi:hypothetical protein